tara:strand:- start:2760 stop:3146 length:387 start_codon:yes stop_codon:yes gene_type:complete
VTVYKLVSVWMAKDRCSCVVSGQGMVAYSVGEWAYPPQWLWERGYGLVAFRDRESAVGYVRRTENYYRGWELWESVGENEISPLPRRRFLEAVMDRGERAWWDEDVGLAWPYGTVMFESLRIERELAW